MCINNCLYWLNQKVVAFLRASDFPSENPRTQKRNYPYTKPLCVIYEQASGIYTYY